MTAPRGLARPWNKLEFLAALRRAGWKRLPGVATVYQSPDDERVTFSVNQYDFDRNGWAWELHAVAHTTPATRKPQ